MLVVIRPVSAIDRSPAATPINWTELAQPIRFEGEEPEGRIVLFQMCRLVHVYHTCGHWGQRRTADVCALRGEQRRRTTCSDSRTEGVIRDLSECARCQRWDGSARQIRIGHYPESVRPGGLWRVNDWTAPRYWNAPASRGSSSNGYISSGQQSYEAGTLLMLTVALQKRRKRQISISRLEDLNWLRLKDYRARDVME